MRTRPGNTKEVNFEPIWERLRDRAWARKEAADKEQPNREAPPPEPQRCGGVTKAGLRCSFNSTLSHRGRMYCKWHYPARKRAAKR